MPSKACEEPRLAFLECLQKSECMKKEQRPLRECLKEVDQVSHNISHGSCAFRS